MIMSEDLKSPPHESSVKSVVWQPGRDYAPLPGKCVERKIMRCLMSG